MQDSLVAIAEIGGNRLLGLDPAALNVTVEGATVQLSGERKLPAGADGQTVRRDGWASTIARTIELPFPVNADAVEARYVNGVPELLLPREPSSKPRQIEIKA